MDIIAALKEEESKLHRQLNAVQGAIAALNGVTNKASVTSRPGLNRNGTNGKRTMSAAVRARISRTAKARWAKMRAEKAAGKKKK
jgi:hypothetical protein